MRKDEERCLNHNRGMKCTAVGSRSPLKDRGNAVRIRVFGSAILPIFEAEKKNLFPHPAQFQSLNMRRIMKTALEEKRSFKGEC